jgi:iron complex outermembrane recepter protein
MRKMQLLKMRYWGIVVLVGWFTSFTVFSQNLKFSGTVSDEFGHPLTGATIEISNLQKGAVTDRKGNFTIENLSIGIYNLEFKFLGYKSATDIFDLKSDLVIRKKLYPENKELHELTVTETAYQRKSSQSLSVETIDNNYLQAQNAGSLMQTLNKLPGVSSMDIGSGQSKPVIRGLGFNRVAVTENGVKHEAQEWGVDHGLEIDQFNIERIEILKGPASLMVGANAIGGVIDLRQLLTPAKNSKGGSIMLNAHSNNFLLGTSAKWHQRFDHFYYKMHATYSDYSDYKVPTDSINYMTYYFKLKNNNLRNTAGRERNGSFTLGYLNDNFSSHLSISDNFSKSGFFANAHGLEIRNSLIDYDNSDRDIDLPSQQVNHLKVLSNTIWMITDYKLNLDMGYQNNLRKEFSEAVEHGNMPLPPDSLERLYNKNTYTANLKLELPQHNKHQFTAGLYAEFQQNESGGWGFMLPNYRTYTAGAFLYDFIRLSEKWNANAGLRYDLGAVHTDAYFDWYTTPTDGADTYIQRAEMLNQTFGSVSGGLGIVRKTEEITLKANVGKSYRMPTAKELSANGINYHYYRYEKGNPTLKAEESYQLDLGVILKTNNWFAEFSPFVNYFPNYIYLNPTPDYYEAQQVFYHSEAEVFRTGGELVLSYEILPTLKLTTDLEYIYSLQLSGSKKGYTLPFSPPATSNIELKYSSLTTNGAFKNPSAGINVKLVASQNNTVPPEKKTAGYALLNFSAGAGLKINKQVVEINLQLTNALNTRYYDHTSFYRLIEVPGQGRNFVATVLIPINI